MKVIYVMADSFRRDHVGVYGYPPWGPVYTPNLDRFAKTASVFDNAYIGSFPTVPNRRDTHLGRCEQNLAFNRWRPLDKNETTFPAWLAEKGIPTMLITDSMNTVTRSCNIQRDYTAWAFNRGQEGEACWMDDTVPLKFNVPPEMIRYPAARWRQILVNRTHRRQETDWFAPGTYSMAMDWLEKNYTRKDFFLWIDTFDPHEPWDPPQHYTDMYDPNYTGRVFEAPPYGIRGKMGITGRELRHIRARYAGEVSMVDHWFGCLMARLEALGIAGETAVIFNSDHGTCLDGPGDMGFIQKIPVADADGFLVRAGRKPRPPMSYYPLSRNVARIPLIIRLPGRRTRPHISSVVQPWDITATILELFGISVPKQVIGRSVLPMLHGRKTQQRKTAVSGFHDRKPGSDSGYAQAMDGKWSYTVWRGERGPALHHMIDDPDYRRNVIGKHPAVVKRLQKSIRDFMALQEMDPEWVARYSFEEQDRDI